MEITDVVKKIFLFLLLSALAFGVILLGKKYFQTPQVNITTPTPNVKVENIIDMVSPWKRPPKYVVYSAEEASNFKSENLILNSEIQAWYRQAKEYPSRAFNAIFYGTPMTGKTSLARQIAKESGLPFVAVKGDDLKDRLYEQRTTKDKFEALLEDLKTNPKTQGKNYILFVDEANHVGDKLNSVKDLLAQVDDKALPNNLWIFATNYIEEIDKAVYENKERLRYKLDFSWNKNIFLDYVQENYLDFLKTKTPKKIDAFGQINQEETIAEVLKKIGSKNQSIYKRFNFESLNLLKSQAENFLAYWKTIVFFEMDNLVIEGLVGGFPYRNKEELKKGIKKFSGVFPLASIPEWKIAIQSLYPHINEICEQQCIGAQAINLGHSRVIIKDGLLSASFEYCLELFWQAKEESNLQGEWSISNPTSFLQWAIKKGYTAEDFGINTFSQIYNGIRTYYANFLGKDIS